ncbi:MAG: ribulose-phosphate 3-epimerase [Coxiellaceae bacterium]|jgi:ribulose-phosphate 3-epimerase|nr:ribulose-phosphate 3-epimerase [Coxiellaceae bacterium]
MLKFLIAPSILSANLSCLGKEVSAVLKAGADIIHFDVMDNHYVPNLTFGPMICEALRKYGIKAPIDVHLMTQPVDNLISAFAKAGASYITFHPEASQHIDRSLQLIHNHGCKAGLALNPATSLDCLEYVWEKLDLILLMAVNPGFGGQKFIPNVFNKTKQLRALIDNKKNHHKPSLEVDGGINLDNCEKAAKAGANIFVVGSAIFNAKEPYKNIITKMRKSLSQQ